MFAPTTVSQMTELLSDIDTPSDAELISRVRGGDVAAYGELFTRHVRAANRLARQLSRGPDADDLVSDAFAKVLTVLQDGGGPDVAFRAYLLTAVRRLHVDRLRAGSRLQTSDDMTQFDPGIPFQDTAVSGFESGAAAKAFASLPERWQLVLWHLEVEGQKPADIAPLLGMSANSVSALAYRAREGLRQAFLTMHLSDISAEQCRWVNEHLGAYVRNGLAKRDAAKVDAHLKECRRCTAMYLELTEVNSNLKAIIAPLLLGAAAAGYLSSTGSLGTAGVLTLLGRARDAILANASVAATGVAAAGVAAVTTAVVLVTHSGHTEVVTSADQPLAATTHVAPSGVVSSGAASGQPSSPAAGGLAAPASSPASPASPPRTTAAAVSTPGAWTTPGALPGTANGLATTTTGTGGTGPATGSATTDAPAGQTKTSATAPTRQPSAPQSTGGSLKTPAPTQHSAPPPTQKPTQKPTGTPSTGPTGKPTSSQASPTPSSGTSTTPPADNGSGSGNGTSSGGDNGGTPSSGSTGNSTGTGTGSGTGTGTGSGSSGDGGNDTTGGTGSASSLSLAPGTVGAPDERGAFPVPMTISGLPSGRQPMTFAVAKDGSTLMGMRAFTATSPVAFGEPPTITDTAGDPSGSCTLSDDTTAACTGITEGDTVTLPVVLENPAVTRVAVTAAGSTTAGDEVSASSAFTIAPPSADIGLSNLQATPSQDGNYLVTGDVTGMPAGYQYQPTLDYSTDGASLLSSSTTCSAPTDELATPNCTANLELSGSDINAPTPVTVTVGPLPGYIPSSADNTTEVILQPPATPPTNEGLSWMVAAHRNVNGDTWAYDIKVTGADGPTDFKLSGADGSGLHGNSVTFVDDNRPADCNSVSDFELSCSSGGSFTLTLTVKNPKGQAASLTVSDAAGQRDEQALPPDGNQSTP